MSQKDKKRVADGSGGQQRENTSVSGLELAALFLDTSWRVAVPILALSLLGHWLDTKQDTTPLFTLVGFFSSLVLAVYLVYRQLKFAFPDMFGGKK